MERMTMARSIEELEAENARLLKLNDGLSRQVISMGETLEAGRRELLATGWEECAKSPTRPNLADNPYRKPAMNFSGALFCKVDEDKP
jgi:hypothetical protein